MGAGVGASARPDGAAPRVFNDGELTLQLTSSMPGVTFNGNTLVCPPVLITTSSGMDDRLRVHDLEHRHRCAGPSVVVTMTASGISAAQVSANKFAIDPHPGPLVYMQTTSQTIYTFTGAQLPATVDFGVLWGADAGTALDNSDLGASIVVTYTVVAESLQGATAPACPVGHPGPDHPVPVVRWRDRRSGRDDHAASDRLCERSLRRQLEPTVRAADQLAARRSRSAGRPGTCAGAFAARARPLAARGRDLPPP